MSFLLRIAGAVAAPVLIASGVGAPLGIAIGAVAVGAGNAGADAIDKAKAEKEANEAAARQKREAQAKLDEQKRAADAKAKEINDALQKKLAHDALPSRVINACKNNQIHEIPALLKQMDNQQILNLGLNPIAACQTADAQDQVFKMIETERKRRKL
jgi:hypothetical protein